MLKASTSVVEAIGSPVRQIDARVEARSGSTLLYTFTGNDNLINFTIERSGNENKFFGFGIFQKITIELLDKNREINLMKEDQLKVIYTIAGSDVNANPLFFIDDIVRDEATNNLTITAYDALHFGHSIKWKDTNFSFPEDIKAKNIFFKLDEALFKEYHITSALTIFDIYEELYYNDSNINLSGEESLIDVLNDLAELFGLIYFIDYSDTLKMISIRNATTNLVHRFNITKDLYFSLETKDAVSPTSIVSTTELGNNIAATLSEHTGETQYIRDNAFMTLREDTEVAPIIEDILTRASATSITPFECEWRGNPLLEPLDKLIITTKDDKEITTYVISDTIEYNGGLRCKTHWNYERNNEETEANPSTLGEVLNQTYAKVDKANKEIELLTSSVSDHESAISQLKLTAKSISASVKSNTETIDELTGNINDLQKEVSLMIDEDSLDIAITEALSNGVDSVSTTTGFTFNSEGLNITSSDSNISTLIDENGMDVSIGDDKVLTADAGGVNAINLTARQYLIIGTRSRIEDFGERTGCFWIGG